MSIDLSKIKIDDLPVHVVMDVSHLSESQQAFIQALVDNPGDIDTLIAIGNMPESEIYNGLVGDLIGVIKETCEELE